MADRRSIPPIYFHFLMVSCVLVGTLVFAEASDTETDPMTEFKSRYSALENALQLPQFVPSAALGRPIKVDQSDFQRLVGEAGTIKNFERYQDGPDFVVSFISERGDDLAVRLDISQIVGRDRMKDAIAGSFDMISAPLDWVEAVPLAGVDRVVRLSPKDTYAIASRGDIFVQVSAGDGFQASAVAAKVLNEIFAAK